MCGSYYFRALPRIFSALCFLAEQRFNYDVTGANCELRPQRLASGESEPPEESSNGFRYREPPLPRSRLSGSGSTESSVILTGLPPMRLLAQWNPIVAEVRRSVGRDWKTAACLIASLSIASAPLARDSYGSPLADHSGSRRAAQDPTLAPR